MPLADPEIGFADIEFEPRLFFTDPALWTTAMKILGLVDSPEGISRLYAETLTSALAIEVTGLRAAMAGGFRWSVAGSPAGSAGRSAIS